jgi:hypothetical protein
VHKCAVEHVFYVFYELFYELFVLNKEPAAKYDAGLFEIKLFYELFEGYQNGYQNGMFQGYKGVSNYLYNLYNNNGVFSSFYETYKCKTGLMGMSTYFPYFNEASQTS